MRAERGLAVAVVLGVLGAPASALGYCRLTTTMAVAGSVCSMTGAPLHWPRQCIAYSVTPREASDDIALDDLRSVVDEAFSTWTDATCGTHVLGMRVEQTEALSMCATPQYNEVEPNSNSIIFVSDWAERELPPEAFGLTLVWHRSKSGVIVDADMQLNEGLGPFAICGARCPRNAVDLQNIITHEAGHFLGLGHSSQSNASMYGKATVGEISKRYLSNDDMEGICAVYGDRAEPACTEADYAPDNGAGMECTIPPESAEGCACTLVGASPGKSGRGALGFALLVIAWCVRRRRRAASRASFRSAAAARRRGRLP